MKRIYYNIISAAIIVVGCVSCSSDNLFMSGSNQLMANEVVASVESQASTRVAIVDAATKSLVWTSGDQISVFDANGSSSTLTLKDDCANQSTGTFGGELNEGFGTMVSAAYPTENTTLSGTTLTMSIPSVISLKDAITVGNNKAYKFPLPMFGKFSDNNVEFKFLTGMLKLSLSNLPANTEKVIITADQPISGTFTASTSADVPILASTSNESANKKITVSFDALAEPGAKVIYIPLAAQEYGSINVQLAGKYDGSTESTKEMVSWTSKTVDRKYVYTAAYGYTIEIDATTPSAVSNAIQNIIQNAEEGSTVNVELIGQVATSSTDKEILIPTDAINVNLAFDYVPSEAAGAPLTINTNQAGNASTMATNKLSITMPESESGIDLNIDAPTSTVILLSATGTTETTKTYKEVVARTAFNTLVVDEDVAVGNAVIEGGVVQVKEDDALESWSFAAKQNGDKVIITEDGGITPLTIPIQDEDGNPLDVPQIIKEDINHPYYAHSLKIVKGEAAEADYAIVWFNNAENVSIPLKTVIVGDNAVLQTNRVAMENIIGEGERTARINYRFDYQPTSNWDEADYGGEGKYYEYSPDMVGVRILKNIIFSQPEIAPNESTLPIVQNFITNGYKLVEPTLKLDVNGVDEDHNGTIEDCTFEYNSVFFCQNSYKCPTIKNCKFVHVDNTAQLSQYNLDPKGYDNVEFWIPMVYNGSPDNISNSITFDGCEFTEGTKINGGFFIGSPTDERYPWSHGNFKLVDGQYENNTPENWFNGDTHFTGYINFNNCKIGDSNLVNVSSELFDNLKSQAYSGTRFVIRFDGVDKYEIKDGNINAL